LTAESPLSSSEALKLVADYGLPTVASAEASNAADATAAAEALGFPVALKTAAPGIAHKTEKQGIMLNIPDADVLRSAYADLADRLGPDVVLTRMSPPGVEVGLGIVRDDQFGAFVMVGAGGILVELLEDRAFVLPPVDRERALEILSRLRLWHLLEGVRGAPRVDIEAVADAIVALSRLADDLGGVIDALDVNPLIATPDGCLAVDALVVPRSVPVTL
jgi:hypothetical protein